MADTSKNEYPAEKPQDAIEVENASSHLDDDVDDVKEIKRVRNRIDWRLIPALGAMYGMALMDRTNLPNAAIGEQHSYFGSDTSYSHHPSSWHARGLELVQRPWLQHCQHVFLHYIRYPPAPYDPHLPQNGP